MPGFIDAHAHIWKIGHLLTTMLDLRGVESLEAIVARVAAFRARRPAGAWLLGRGYNEATIAEGRAPTRARPRPRRAGSAGGPDAHLRPHLRVELGGAGARRHHRRHGRRRSAGRSTATPTASPRRAARNGDGAGARVHAAAVADDYERMIIAALRHQLSLGITIVVATAASHPQLLDVYRAMDAGGRLPARVNVMPLRRVDGVPAPVPLPETARLGHACGSTR